MHEYLGKPSPTNQSATIVNSFQGNGAALLRPKTQQMNKQTNQPHTPSLDHKKNENEISVEVQQIVSARVVSVNK
jgi:hypothetical protein